MTIQRFPASHDGMAGIAAVREMLAARRDTPATPVAERRARMEAFAAAAPDVPGTTTVATKVGGRSALRVTPADSCGTVLFLHGGAYVLGSATTHAKLAARYADAAGHSFVVLDYRLAPEHPYPAALEDAVAAWEELARGDAVALAGDSAGGGLVLATAVALRDRGLPQPRVLAMIAPWADLTLAGASMTANAERDAMLSAPVLAADAERYRGMLPADDPRISPLFADLAGLPPMVVQVGGDEVLLDDTLRLHQRAVAAGVRCEVEIWEGMTHAFGAFAHVPEAARSIARLGKALRG